MCISGILTVSSSGIVGEAKLARDCAIFDSGFEVANEVATVISKVVRLHRIWIK